MMLDVKSEEANLSSLPRAIVGVIIAGVFAGMVTNAALRLPGATDNACPVKALCCCDYAAEATEGEPGYAGELPALADDNRSDVKSLGATLFSQYNIPFVILSFALLAGTVGAVALGRKIRKD